MSQAAFETRGSLNLNLKFDIGHAFAETMGYAFIDKTLLFAVATEFFYFGGCLHSTGTAQTRRNVCRRLLAETGSQTPSLGVSDCIELEAYRRIVLKTFGSQKCRNLFGLPDMAVGSMMVGDKMIWLTHKVIRSLYVGRYIYESAENTSGEVVDVHIVANECVRYAGSPHLLFDLLEPALLFVNAEKVDIVFVDCVHNLNLIFINLCFRPECRANL